MKPIPWRLLGQNFISGSLTSLVYIIIGHIVFSGDPDKIWLLPFFAMGFGVLVALAAWSLVAVHKHIAELNKEQTTDNLN